MVTAPVAVRRHPRVGMPLLHVAHPSGASCSRPAPRVSCNLTFNFHELFSLGLKKQKALTVRRPPAKLRLSCAACACRHDCTRVRGGAFARGIPHHPDARRAIFSFFSS